MTCSDKVGVTLPEFNAFLIEMGLQIEELLARGDAYRWGTEAVERDTQMALAYYSEAAELGDWEAMSLLADLLEELGREAEAAPWRARLAAEAGQ